MIALLVAIVMSTAQQPGAIETIVRDNMSVVDDARQAVANTQAEWAALWRAHNSAAPTPAVDFSKRTVVAVFLGTRPSAGYSVEVTGTKRDGKTLIVEWREFPPQPGNLSAQVLTSPAHIASIPKFDGEIRFVKVDR
jgi:hypothetical protein